MLTLEKYSMGVGDRFGRQAKAQLHAIMKAAAKGVVITPVWNKSHREHTIIGTKPMSARRSADAAVKALGYNGSYHVDADHIGLKNVDLFLEACDFYTLDVADFIGKKTSAEDIETFIKKYCHLSGQLAIDGIDESLHISPKQLHVITEKYLGGVKEAGKIYRYIEAIKGEGNFITEVSMDETDEPQTPVEMLVILAAIADEKIPAQTIAPKFTGRFNKGVDYVGDPQQFGREFDQDMAVIRMAVKEFGLPVNLKLSVHSGSDKFSLYPFIRRSMIKFNAGVHLKTAGTTWLEELIGLAEAGGDGLAIAKEVYAAALGRFDELCGPYATVIDIDKNQLPDPTEVTTWDGPRFARTLRHDRKCTDFNPHFRQLLHVGYKVAA
ncbi:MAG: hypothetical protein JW709_04880, partial [Sedimentisphaerales bacterium]|nr:hypothetical protein [Sedimentisphaerales bacterium]